MVSSLLERDNQISGRGPRSEVALAHDHDGIGPRLLDGLLGNDRFDFAGADEASFQLFAVEGHFVKAIEAPASGDFDRCSGALCDSAWGDLDVARCCPPRTNVRNRVLIVGMEIAVDDLAI